MDPFKEFCAEPSLGQLRKLTVDDLWRVIGHYNLTLDVEQGKTKKKDLMVAVQQGLEDQGVLTGDAPPSPSPVKLAGGVEIGAGLSFEQHKELLEIQLQTQIELEKLRLENDMKVKLELEKLRLAQPRNEAVVGGRRSDNISDMVRLLPKFNEKDPDVFFSLFESLAEERGWSDADRTSLIQSVLPPKAQDAYIALLPAERKVYATVKSAILLAYELCAEAYRSCFRTYISGLLRTLCCGRVGASIVL